MYSQNVLLFEFLDFVLNHLLLGLGRSMNDLSHHATLEGGKGTDGSHPLALLRRGCRGRLDAGGEK